MQRNPTSYHNKAVIAEGVKPILPLRWEFFLIIPYFTLNYPSIKFVRRRNKEHNKKGVQPISIRFQLYALLFILIQNVYS